jgi:carbon-monoxide dehydrogenase small subunit
MTVEFTLNGREVSVQTRPETLLVEILRGEFGMTGTRSGCMQGECGICSVLVDDQLTVSCMVPAFNVSGCSVTTVEGFVDSEEFADVATGFERAGMEPCGFCIGAKVLLTHWIITHSPNPSAEELQTAATTVQCRCTVHKRFIDGIRYAAEARRKRLHVRTR